jgi:hypothetical protein
LALTQNVNVCYWKSLSSPCQSAIFDRFCPRLSIMSKEVLRDDNDIGDSSISRWACNSWICVERHLERSRCYEDHCFLKNKALLTAWNAEYLICPMLFDAGSNGKKTQGWSHFLQIPLDCIDSRDSIMASDFVKGKHNRVLCCYLLFSQHRWRNGELGFSYHRWRLQILLSMFAMLFPTIMVPIWILTAIDLVWRNWD